MLVLSRRQGESVLIDGGIKIVIVEIRGNVIRLGIDAPEETRIVREELTQMETGK
jgi:carbon storage regulator